MAKWRYPGYLPKPPHKMTDFDWQSYKTGLSKDQMSERYSGITSDLIPAFEQIQAQGLGDINPDPYKRVSPFGPASESKSISEVFFPGDELDRSNLAEIQPIKSNQIDPAGSQTNVGYDRSHQMLLGDSSLSYLPSKSELDDHYLNGEGRSITVPIDALPLDQVNWSKASRDLIRASLTSPDGYVSGIVHVSFYGTSAWSVLGQMNFDLAGTLETLEDGTYQFEGGVDASGGGEMYDFEMHSGITQIPRNVFTWLGKPRWDREPDSEPQPFFIDIPGTYGIRFGGRL